MEEQPLRPLPCQPQRASELKPKSAGSPPCLRFPALWPKGRRGSYQQARDPHPESPRQGSKQQSGGVSRTVAKRSGIAVGKVTDFPRDVRTGVTDLSSRSAGPAAHEIASPGAAVGIQEVHQSGTGADSTEGRYDGGSCGHSHVAPPTVRPSACL